MAASRFFDEFFDDPVVFQYASEEPPTILDADWDQYNEFFCDLSREVDILIPFDNTNAIATYNKDQAPWLQFHDMPDLEHIICNRDKGRVLMMHIAVFESFESDVGHSCLLLFDTDTCTQEFIDPCGYYGDNGISQRMKYYSLLDGYHCVSKIRNFNHQTVQHLFESRGSRWHGLSGLMCVLLGLSYIYGIDMRQVYMMQQDDVRAVLENLISWFHHGFLQGLPLELPEL